MTGRCVCGRSANDCPMTLSRHPPAPDSGAAPMRTPTCLALSSLLVLSAFAAAPPAKVPAEWLKFIDQLGDDDEKTRQAAEKELASLGEDVLPALRRAHRGHADPDVRLTAGLLVAAIEKT